MNRFFTIRATTRIFCATTTLLSLGAITGLTVAPPAQASGNMSPVTLTSVSAPTRFTAGQSISVQVGLEGGAAQVHVTSLPAGVVDYTATASNDTPLSVPTNPVPGAQSGSDTAVTLIVTLCDQSISTNTVACSGDFEPIFPRASAASTDDIKGDFEPIFPRASASEYDNKGDFEPIFPKVTVSSAGDFEPIFPKATTASAEDSKGDFEPIFPRALASRFRRINTAHVLFAHR